MKKKQFVFLCLCLISVGGMVIWMLSAHSPFKESVIHIAAVVPVNDTSGKEILMGINLHLNKINRQGGVNGRRVKLLILDDNNDKRMAKAAALQIADQSPAILVLGHNYSSTSIAAGKIYKSHQIPAITASATAEGVTMGNDWYFSVIPNNTLQAGFIANYINKSLKKKRVSIIFTKDAYGISLNRAFQDMARKTGMELVGTWEVDVEGGNVADDLRRIADEVNRLSDPGMIFLTLFPHEAALLIKRMKDAGNTFPIMGPDTFTSSLFLEEMGKFPRELAEPGYYSNGVYCTSPFMMDIGDLDAYAFGQEFLRQYKTTPTWISAYYYDAAKLAVEAIRRVHVQGEGYIRGNRRQVRDALTGFYDETHAMKGITGHIHFDPHGNTGRPYAIGIYQSRKLLPAPSQYQQIMETERIGQIFRKVLDGEIIAIEGRFMTNTQLVHVGMDMNEISELNMKNSTCTLDFHLRFSFSGELDDTNIEFRNSASPVRLGEIVSEETDGRMTTRVYRVRAAFRGDFDFHDYPFDHQVMPIRFRHGNRTRDKLIYAPDMHAPASPAGVAVGEWRVGDISVYQDILAKEGPHKPRYATSQETLSYSQFNVDIRFERKGLGHAIRCFLPIIVAMLLLYLSFFVPLEWLGTRVFLFMVAFLTNAGFHLRFLSDLPVEYLTTLEHAFLLVYGLGGVSAWMSLSIHRLHACGSERMERFLTRGGRLGYPVAISSTILIWEDLAWAVFLVCLPPACVIAINHWKRDKHGNAPLNAT